MKKLLIIFLAALLAAPAWARGASEKENRFLGLSVTASAPIALYSNPDYHTQGFGAEALIGVDYAHRLTDRFALGFYAMIGGGPVFSRHIYADDNSVDWNSAKPGINLKAGLLMLAGDILDKPYIIGIAPCTGFCFCNPSIYLPAEVRFGRMITKGLYLTGNVAFGLPLGYNDGTEHNLIFEPSLTLGFKF
ncbi:MAG: hypothetical protein J5702_00260 [Bacteroidales bacterium]|nr:hypothetical protein [Bacteroidales bacterium]